MVCKSVRKATGYNLKTTEEEYRIQAYLLRPRRFTHAQRREYNRQKLVKRFGDEDLTKKGLVNGLPEEIIQHILGYVPSVHKFWSDEVAKIRRRKLRKELSSRAKNKYPNSRAPWRTQKRFGPSVEDLKRWKSLRKDAAASVREATRIKTQAYYEARKSRQTPRTKSVLIRKSWKSARTRAKALSRERQEKHRL